MWSVWALSQDRGKPSPYYIRAWQAASACIVGGRPCGRPREEQKGRDASEVGRV